MALPVRGPAARLVAVSCLGMATFGIVLTTLGASLQSVITRFGIDKAQAGALLSLLSFSVLAGSVVFGPIVDRRGYRGVLLLSFATIVVGLEAIAFAPSLMWLRTGLVLIGVSGGVVNGAANALAADVGGVQRGAILTFVGGFFGVGAVGVPLVLSALADSFRTTTILAAVPAFVALPLAVTATATFPTAKQPHGFPVMQARRLLHDPALLLMGVMLFLESGMETTVGGWVTILFGEELGVSAERAPLYLALFWLGLMVTRLTLGATLRSVSGTRVLFVSVAVAFVSSVVLVATRDVASGGVAAFCLGAGFAPMFPVMFGFVGDRYAHLSGTALSIVMSMALVGGMLMPYVAGVLGGGYGLRLAFALIPASLVLLALLLAILVRRLAPARADSSSRQGHVLLDPDQSG